MDIHVGSRHLSLETDIHRADMANELKGQEGMLVLQASIVDLWIKPRRTQPCVKYALLGCWQRSVFLL